MASSSQFNHSIVNVNHGTFQNYESVGKGVSLTSSSESK